MAILEMTTILNFYIASEFHQKSNPQGVCVFVLIFLLYSRN